MSYLLQSQIDIVERDAKFESLTEKVAVVHIVFTFIIFIITFLGKSFDKNRPS